MTRWTLPPDRIPSAWFNVVPHLPTPLDPPLHPGTREPVGPQDLAPLFPAALIEQEVSAAPWIDVPGEVLDILRLWRPTPLVRAVRLEKALGTPARIYFKDESVSPAGSHKPNTAVPQAFYNHREPVPRRPKPPLVPLRRAQHAPAREHPAPRAEPRCAGSGGRRDGAAVGSRGTAVRATVVGCLVAGVYSVTGATTPGPRGRRDAGAAAEPLQQRRRRLLHGPGGRPGGCGDPCGGARRGHPQRGVPGRPARPGAGALAGSGVARPSGVSRSPVDPRTGGAVRCRNGRAVRDRHRGAAAPRRPYRHASADPGWDLPDAGRRPAGAVPADSTRVDDGGVQNVVATSAFAIAARRFVDMDGTTDHPGLLVDLRAAGSSPVGGIAR